MIKNNQRIYIQYNQLEDIEPDVLEYVITVSGKTVAELDIDTVNDYLNNLYAYYKLNENEYG